MNIVYLYSDDPQRPGEWNSSEWRCVIPAQAISQSRSEHTAHSLAARDFFESRPGTAHLCNEADVIVVERGFYGSSVRKLLEWRDKGKKLVIDFDDAYHLMSASNPSYSFWRENQFGGQKLESVIAQFTTNLQIVHAATVPSQLLALDYIGLLPTHVLPNYLPAKRYLNLPKPPEHVGVWLGWGGSMTHWDSWTRSGLLEAMRNFLPAHPDVRLVIVASDARLRRALALGGQVIFHDWTTHDRWPELCQQFDLGLAPLAGEYDDRRSWLKVAEYLALGVPFVCSNRPPYRDLVEHGFGVDIDNAEGWRGALETVYQEREARKIQALKLQAEMGQALTMEANVGRYLDVYQRLLA